MRSPPTRRSSTAGIRTSAASRASSVASAVAPQARPRPTTSPTLCPASAMSASECARTPYVASTITKARLSAIPMKKLWP